MRSRMSSSLSMLSRPGGHHADFAFFHFDDLSPIHVGEVVGCHPVGADHHGGFFRAGDAAGDGAAVLHREDGAAVLVAGGFAGLDDGL